MLKQVKKKEICRCKTDISFICMDEIQYASNAQYIKVKNNAQQIMHASVFIFEITFRR